MMDYGAIPPEINSARLYAGPGSTPMLEAARAWGTLSTGLSGTAAEHIAVVTTLGTVWMGPAAQSMQRASAAYSSWLTQTALAAERTAAQALAAAAAYETAYAATVAPQLVAANRALLAQLVASNVFGQNTAAIAATEAQYVEMWAQDAAAMYAYEAQSALATVLQPFTTAPQLSGNFPFLEGTGPVGQFITNLLGSTPAQLINSYAEQAVSGGYPLNIAQLFGNFIGYGAMTQAAQSAAAAAHAAATATIGAQTVAPVATAISAPAVKVSVGGAQRIGPMSVPPSWTAVPPASSGLPPVRPLPTAEAEELPMPFPLPMAVPRSGTPPKQEKPPPEYGAVVRFVPRPPSGG